MITTIKGSIKRWLDLLQEDSPNWDEVLTQLNSAPEEARAWDTETGYTALHYAVLKAMASTEISLSDSKKSIEVIKGLLRLYPEAAKKSCFKNGYTPLSYACLLSTDNSSDLMKDQAHIIRLLLARAPEALQIVSKEGNLPLDVHIMSATRLAGSMSTNNHQQKTVELSTKVLKVLAASSSAKDLERGLERLYACNTLEIFKRCAQEEARSRSLQRNGRSSGGSVVSTLRDFWIWKWALVLLKAIHRSSSALNQDGLQNKAAPFRPLHVAAQIKDCPVPFLAMAVWAYPSEVRIPDPRLGNLPLHHVAGWQLAEEDDAAAHSIASTCRKSMCLTTLVVEYPKSIHTKNGDGLNAKQIEEQSGSIIPPLESAHNN